MFKFPAKILRVHLPLLWQAAAWHSLVRMDRRIISRAGNPPWRNFTCSGLKKFPAFKRSCRYSYKGNERFVRYNGRRFCSQGICLHGNS
ncbi:hypothetical protein D1970_02380 [Mesobacillus zeae]|uniref:Uncharacterized protein n=1 Tax=Mesobacillus zeae TaxID=1917180 RepID=A0A398BJT8_9BACI|nr:hypothetical protein D1970_02380 [Mesobacillus zeae]